MQLTCRGGKGKTGTFPKSKPEFWLCSGCWHWPWLSSYLFQLNARFECHTQLPSVWQGTESGPVSAVSSSNSQQTHSAVILYTPQCLSLAVPRKRLASASLCARLIKLDFDSGNLRQGGARKDPASCLLLLPAVQLYLRDHASSLFWQVAWPTRAGMRSGSSCRSH